VKKLVGKSNELIKEKPEN